MAAIRHRHHSGRFDASTKEWQRYAAENTTDTDILTGTEATTSRAARALQALDGWGGLTGGTPAHECIVLVRLDRLKLVHHGYHVLSGKRWYTAKGHKQPAVHAAVAVVEDRQTGQRTAWVAAHLASHIQGFKHKGKISGPVRRVAAWLADVNALRKLRKRLHKQYGCPVMVSPDSNVDQRLAWCRVACKPLGKLATWHKPYPKRGTYGHRLIDATWTTGTVTVDHAHIRALLAGFDHRPFTESIHPHNSPITPHKPPKGASVVKPPAPPYIPARHHGGHQTPHAIVMHGTVSPDTPGTARNIANWWHGPTSPVTSAHYVVDPDETIQCVYDHTVAYHCGYNQDSIGVEMCDEEKGPASRWDDANSRAIIARAAALVARLCVVYNIDPNHVTVASLKAHGPHGIYSHNQSRLAFGHTSHTDPRQFPWPKFMVQVHAEIHRLNGGSSTHHTAPEEDDDMPTPKDLWDYKLPNRRPSGEIQAHWPAHQFLTNIEKDQDALRHQVAHLTELVQQLADKLDKES